MDIFSRVATAVASAPVNLLKNIAESLFYTSPKKTGFDSDFLKPRDISSRLNFGFSVTGNRFLTAKESTRHMLVVSPSGGGKSTTVAIPSGLNIIRHGGSLVCHDPSGEIMQYLLPYAHQSQYNSLILNMADSTCSDGWNPLKRARSMSDYMKICSALVRNSLGKAKGDSAFWNNSAVNFLALMTAVVKTLEPQYHTMANVKQLVELFLLNPETIDVLVSRCDENIVQEYKIILKQDPRVMTNVISTCRSAMNLWLDDHLRVMTSFDSINMESFTKEKTILFIRTSTSDMHFYSVLTSLFMEQMFGSMMSRLPKRQDRFVYFILDEASSLYLDDTLQLALSNLRKFGGAIQIFLQDKNQLKHLYGQAQAEAIISNTYCKVYFNGMPIDVCRELEQSLGKWQFEGKDGKMQTRALLTADEIQCMEENRTLVFCTGKRACYAEMHPFYRNMRYKRLTSIPMPVLTKKAPFDTVPLFRKLN